MDEAVFRALYGGSTPSTPIFWAMIALTVVGSGWSMVAFIPFAVVRRTRRIGAFLLATLVTTSLVVFVVKIAVHRARPVVALQGVHALAFAAPTDPSFPSGHAAGAFAFATFVATVVATSDATRRQKVLAVTALVALAIGIACSRVYLGVHFPSDVGAGAMVGTILGYLGARLALRRVAQPSS